MCLTESTILFCFHSVRMSLLILGHVVVTLLAFCTCQCDFCAHDFHLHLNFRFFGPSLILSIKKRPKLFHSPAKCIINMLLRQGFSLFFLPVQPCRKMNAVYARECIGNEYAAFVFMSGKVPAFFTVQNREYCIMSHFRKVLSQITPG